MLQQSNEAIMKPIIKLESISKQYTSGDQDVEILNDVNIEVFSSEKLIITGESGSGKTTVLSIIAGLEAPSSGKVIIDSLETQHLSELELSKIRLHKLGFIFQLHYLLKDFSVKENVMLPGKMAGMEQKILSERADELIAAVKLDHRSGFYPNQLSGGERQRCAIARSLINDPPVILADEPTGNLDEANSRQVEDMLFSLVDQRNKSIVLVTHERQLLDKGDRCLFLHNKKLLNMTASEIRELE